MYTFAVFLCVIIYFLKIATAIKHIKHITGNIGFFAQAFQLRSGSLYWSTQVFP